MCERLPEEISGGIGEISEEMSEEISEECRLTAEAEDEGTRLDTYLAGKLGDMTRSYLQQLIEEGRVSVTGRKKTAKNYRLREGDEVNVKIPPPKALDVCAEDIPLDIVYEDDSLLVVNKPKGMVVHPAAGNESGTLVNALMYHCGDNLSSINGVIRPGIVHRIDKDTSGLLVVAKTDQAHRKLSEQLKAHSMTRSYIAVAYHPFREPEGTVDAPNRQRQKKQDENGRYDSAGGQTCGNTLQAAGFLQRLRSDRMPPGDRQDTSDSGAYGIYPSSSSRRSGIRPEKNGFRCQVTDAACRDSGIHPPGKRRVYGIFQRTSGNIPENLRQYRLRSVRFPEGRAGRVIPLHGNFGSAISENDGELQRRLSH